MSLVTLPGVFAPHSDSELLADAVRRERHGPDTHALDLCTGSGVVALAAAEAGATVTAVDVSLRALVTVRVNAWKHGKGHQIHVRHGHLFGPVSGRRFDLIASNPPYVPAPTEELPRRGAARAWAAGTNGRLILDELCDRAPDHLLPGGVLLLVHSSLIDEGATLDRLAARGLDARVDERVRGPLGPLMREGQAAGVVPPHVDHEDVVVIRATRPR